MFGMSVLGPAVVLPVAPFSFADRTSGTISHLCVSTFVFLLRGNLCLYFLQANTASEGQAATGIKTPT